MTLSEQTSAQLRAAGLDPAEIVDLVLRALDEDLAGGVDVTSAATVPAEQRSTLDLVCRQAGVIAGAPVAATVFEVVRSEDPRARAAVVTADGVEARVGAVVVSASGFTRDLLTAERTALNLLCHLSGIATATAAWARAFAGTTTRVRDTRKTTPGLRALEKYAVRCGGGINHRMALSDAALVKDNHVVAAGGVGAAFEAVRAMWPDLPVEVEVDSLDQLDEVLAAGADLVLLDNFTMPHLREAVRRAAAMPTRPQLEASGGLTLADAAELATTGVDFVAVGALTHSAAVLDVGADLRPIDS